MKSKYEHMYIPIGNMKHAMKNNTYLFDYGHNQYYETTMTISGHIFTILHTRDICKYEPSHVTYMLYCPICSKYGQESVMSSYLHTGHKNLRFYLTHSNNKCRTRSNIKANLLCDQCHTLL